jgi:hypothetical protein
MDHAKLANHRNDELTTNGRENEDNRFRTAGKLAAVSECLQT